MGKKAAVLDVEALKEELKGVDADFDARYKALDEELKKAKDDKMQGLKDQRAKLAQQRNEADIAITKIDKLIQDLGGKAPKTRGGGGGTRTRRSPEELQADAKKIIDFLKKNPNSKASAIKESTGVNWGLNLPEFVKNNSDEKVKTEGKKAGMTYSVA